MEPTEHPVENWSEEKIKRRTLLSFGVFTAVGLAGIFGWRRYLTQPANDNGLTATPRKVLTFNENLNEAYFGEHRLAPTYPVSRAAKPARVNGDIGINTDIDLAQWRLEIVHPEGARSEQVALADIKSLPKQDIVFDFKCIEGWDQIMHYGGVRLSDLMQKYNFGTKSDGKTYYKYVGMETPDGAYYVGLDMKSALHPQTLLCYENNDAPLTIPHGAPLRLAIPVKYGVKNLKCVGKIFLSDERPRDYWHENGYEYDAAL